MVILPSKIYNNPNDLRDIMEKYIKSCKVYNQIKLRSDGCDILEDISTLDGKSSFIWIKAPSVAGFCNFAGINRLTYYNYKKRQGYDEVCEEFELLCDEADMDCQYSKEAQNGARWRLQLRGYETEKEKQERLALEQAIKIKQEKHEADMKLADVKNKLLEIQLERAKNNGEVDPLITQLIKDIGWGGDSGQ